jgi:PAS domain S-box-containing protein
MNEPLAKLASLSDAKLRPRILLVGMTGGLPLFLVALLLINVAYSTPIEFGQQERRGLAFARQVESVLEALSSYASAARRASVDPAETEAWLMARRDVDQNVQTLASSYQGELGRQLGFDGAQLRAQGRALASLDTLQNSWRELRLLPAAAAAGPHGMTNMVVSLRAMTEVMGDRSNLILDVDLDSFYLADIVLALPLAQQRLLEVAPDLDTRHEVSESQRASRSQVLSAFIRENDLAHIERNAKRALDEDARFNGVSPSLHAELPRAVAEYAASTRLLLEALERAQGEHEPGATTELVGPTLRARTASFALFRTVADQLDQLLANRLSSIQGQRARAYWAIVATLAGAALVMGLMVRGLLAARNREATATQEELRAKEAQLRALGDNLPGGMTYQVARKPDGSLRFLYVSAGVEHLHGVTAAAVLANPSELFDLLLPEDVPALQAAELESRTNKTPFRMVARSRRRPDGAIRWLEFASAPRDLPDGSVVWDGIQLDVTERHLADAAVRQSQQRFSHIFDNSPIPITLSNLNDGKFIAANDSFLRFSGYAREEVLGRTSLDLNLYTDPSQRAVILDRLRRDGRIHGLELPFRTKSGALCDNMLWLETLTIDAERFLLVMALDVTEQKAAERQQKELEEQLRQAQKLDALGTLAGGIAHDFNNILGAIISYSELSKLDNPDNPALGQNLDEVLRASQRATVLVRQILSFSRQQKEERRAMQLAPIIREALSLLRATLPTTISIEQALDVPVDDVLVNATQVHQIVMNLCTNAAHAMRGRQGKLRVALDAVRVGPGAATPHVGLEPGNYVRLLVSDSGHGMDAATLKRIFEPFFTTKIGGEGTGLGLSVVHGIVKEYQGVVTIDSQVGCGTTFHIYLPSAPASQAAAPAESNEAPCGNGERVLIVDDEPALGAATHKMLTRLGYQATVHQSSLAALTALQQAPHAFAALVTDFTMPEMTGLELARAALALRPDLAVLLLSGSTASLPAEELRAIGVRGVLNKPVGYAPLARALHQALRGPRS